MKPALEQRQAVMRERFKSGLPSRMKARRDDDKRGKDCLDCGTPFVPFDPDSEICGWCRAKAKRLTIQ